MNKKFNPLIKIFLFILIVGTVGWLIYKLPIQSYKKTLAKVGLEQKCYQCQQK